MNSLLGLIYSCYFSLRYHRRLFSCRFANIPNIKSRNFKTSVEFFAGRDFYVRGNKYSKIFIDTKVLFGPDVMLLAGNHVTNHTQSHLYDYNLHDDRSKDIVVNKGAWVGARSILLSGAEIGEGSIVGCNSVVNAKLKPYCIYAGTPAKLISPRFTKSELCEILQTTGSELSISNIPFKDAN